MCIRDSQQIVLKNLDTFYPRVPSCRALLRCVVQVLVTNAVSVDQWTYQFKLWTTIQDENMGRFTSSNKNWFAADAGVMVCTYSMIAGTFKRAAGSQRVFDAIVGREWGLILLDEVHVVPAEMFRCASDHGWVQ